MNIVTLKPEGEDAYDLDSKIERRSLRVYGETQWVVAAALQNFSIIYRLRQAIKAAKPDVVIAMMAENAAILSIAVLGLSDLKTIGAIRTDPNRHPRRWRYVLSYTLGRLSAIVVQTRDAGRWVQQHTNATRIAVIPNPVSWPLPANQPTVPPGAVCPSEKRLLLAVGRLIPEKGFDLLIDAFAAISVKNPEWVLAILGEGPKREDLERLVKVRGLEGKILLPGWAGNLADWYRAAELFALSSRSEGFPNALLEAMMHGLAVVSTNCNFGPKDIIQDGVNGLLVPEGTAHEMAIALNVLMGNPQLRQKLGREAELIRERFAIDSVASGFEQLFYRTM